MKTILIADDLPDHLDLLEVVLQRSDCRLLRADNGAAALRLARSHAPDIVFLDIEMPGLNGAEVCRLLKAEPSTASRPVVLVSVRDHIELSQRCGADLFLRKPVDEPVLLSTLARFLDVSSRREERALVDWPIQFWRDGVAHSGRLMDLSREGFFIECASLQTPGARLAVSFSVPAASSAAARAIFAEAIVVRWEQEARSGMGCRFFRPSRSNRRSIEEFLGATD
jgi:CheY-like chemotaxis protein